MSREEFDLIYDFILFLIGLVGFFALLSGGIAVLRAYLIAKIKSKTS